MLKTIINVRSAFYLYEKKFEVGSVAGYLKLPSAATLHALFATCGPARLKKILERHHLDEHKGLSGVPDLFLFAINDSTGITSIARFVEVKKSQRSLSHRFK